MGGPPGKTVVRLSLFALSLLAIQSAFYGPAKFGVIPDLVDDRRLSQANGLVNALTNLAVILGSLAAGPLADMYYPTKTNPAAAELQAGSLQGSTVTGVTVDNHIHSDQQPQLVPDRSRTPQRLPIGVTLVFVSVLGLVTVLRMPRMKAVKPQLRLSYDLLGSHLKTFQAANSPLIVVLFSWAGFYFIAALALLLIPDFRETLLVSNAEITRLTGVLAISIVIGSCTVGYLSGQRIRPSFALFGAVGMTACFFIMGVLPMSYRRLAALIFLVGFFAGCYIVPLQSLLQHLSPADERGRFFGTANALSFAFISLAGVSFYTLRRIGVSPERMPLVCGALALVGTIIGMLELKRIKLTHA